MTHLIDRIGGMLAGCITPVGAEIVEVDLLLTSFPVNVANARIIRQPLIEALREWPTEALGEPVPPLAEGPSYILAGAVLDSQHLALQLFAVGSVLEFWTIASLLTLGVDRETSVEMAGSGFLMAMPTPQFLAELAQVPTP